jgi:hypothetical protein
VGELAIEIRDALGHVTIAYSKNVHRRANRLAKKAGNDLCKVESQMAHTVPATLLGLIALHEYQAELAIKNKYAELFVQDDYFAFMRSTRTAIGNFAAAGTLPTMANA